MIANRNESGPHPDADQAWAFCVAEYARPGAAEALLRLQDEQGLDVVLHLFARYARERLGRALDADALAEAARLVEPWRAQVLLPLRAVRRATGADAAADPAVRALRERVKAAELDAERVQLERLCAWLAGTAASPGAGLRA